MSDANFNETQPQKSNVALLIVLGGCGCVVVFLLVIGVLAALMIPAISGAREAARRMQCTNHMKQIGLAMHTYHDAHKCLPPVYTVDEDGNPLHSWRVLMLPYMEQQHLYDQIRLDEPWDSEYNKQFHSYPVSAYSCPASSDFSTGMTTYSVVVGAETIFGDPTTQVSLGDLTDGSSNTIFLVERKTPVCWMDPTQEITFEEACKGINVSGSGIGSNHTGGANACMFDGSVLYISESIDPDSLRGGLTKAGGESYPLY